jgi:hypothetical protein
MAKKMKKEDRKSDDKMMRRDDMPTYNERDDG